MGAPYLALTKRLNAAGAAVSYADVLLVSDIFEEREGTVLTPHHDAAYLRLWAWPSGVITALCQTIEVERARRRCVLSEVSQ